MYSVRESDGAEVRKSPKPWLGSQTQRKSRLTMLALALSPRLGPTMRRLVEHFGSVQNIFKASLTELGYRHSNRLGAIARHRPVRSRGGSRRIERHQDHIALLSGTESRGVRRTRQCHQQKFLGTEHPDQTRRQAHRHMGGCVGRTPYASATCPHSG